MTILVDPRSYLRADSVASLIRQIILWLLIVAVFWSLVYVYVKWR